MGSNASCKLVSIGSIQIKMHDGIVRTLTNVCHVLELKKNLVYVGSMDSKGFSCWVEGGFMQIRGKGKSVVMKGTKQGNMLVN